MAGHGFGGTYRNFFPKQISDGVGFESVADGRRSAVGVEVSDYAGVEFCVAQGVAHDTESTFVLGSGLSHVIGVGGHAVAYDLRKNGSVAAAGVLEFF